MKNLLFFSLMSFAVSAFGQMQITSPSLSPMLNEYDNAKLSDEASRKVPVFAVVYPDANGVTGISGAAFVPGVYSQVTGRQGFPQYALASGANLPIIAFAGVDPVSHLPVPLKASLRSQTGIAALTSSASASGLPSQFLTVTGLLSTDTVLAVSQSASGSLSQPVIAYGAPLSGSIQVTWPSNPGAGAQVNVLVQHM